MLMTYTASLPRAVALQMGAGVEGGSGSEPGAGGFGKGGSGAGPGGALPRQGRSRFLFSRPFGRPFRAVCFGPSPGLKPSSELHFEHSKFSEENEIS
jgi:hypothetical protein